MARMKKVDLIAKIAKEQNLNPEQLERLPMIELEKMDKVVPDSAPSDGDILGGGDDAPADSVSPTGAEAGPVVVESPVLDAPVESEVATSDDHSEGSGAGDSSESQGVPADTGAPAATTNPDEEIQEEGSAETVKSPEGKEYIGNDPATGEAVYQ